MYENGQVVDWMRVVVGKPAQPTPMMAAMIRFTAVNPYWNVPSDLAAERDCAQRRQGGPRLSARDRAMWCCPTGARMPSRSIRRGRLGSGRGRTDPVRVRQNPGPGQCHGADEVHVPQPRASICTTRPNKELLNEAARLFSGGLRAAGGCAAAGQMALWQAAGRDKGEEAGAAGRPRTSRCRSIWPI